MIALLTCKKAEASGLLISGDPLTEGGNASPSSISVPTKGGITEGDAETDTDYFGYENFSCFFGKCTWM